MSQEKHEHHVTPASVYIKVYVGLLCLTVLTVVMAHVNLGHFNTPVALLIAIVKSLLVLIFFMHLKYEGSLNRVTISSALIFAIIFFSLTAMDVFTRKNYTEIGLEQKREALLQKEKPGQAPAEKPAEEKK
jgi:cytochrome c oxidase subunit 4